jgi:hypothetical protein
MRSTPGEYRRALLAATLLTWSNCGTNSNGAFTANYANTILTPVVPTCPIFVKLTGSGAPLNIQWWGG